MMNLGQVRQPPASIIGRRIGVKPSSESFSMAMGTSAPLERGEKPEARAEADSTRIRESKIKVLCIGDDEVLLSTRHMVLQEAGFLVRSLPSRKVVEEVEVRSIDLVLFCHSVRLDRVLAATRFLRKQNPTVIVLQLCFGGLEGATGDIEQIAPDGPRQLLLQIEKALRAERKKHTSVIHAVHVASGA